MKKLYRFSLRFAHQVWCLNTDDADYFIHNKIVPVHKIKILPGEGVDTNHFKKDVTVSYEPSMFTFLMCARLLKTKGIVEFAQATLLLRQKNLHFRCLLLGAEENHPDAISSAQIFTWQQEFGLLYLGFTDDVRTHLTKADCFVYPSYYNEGIPRSLLEACSMELPVITTDNTGCRNLIQDGVNGFLCNKKDPVSLADKMEKMMKLDSNRRIQMGKSGMEMVKATYSIDKVEIFYARVLESLFG